MIAETVAKLCNGEIKEVWKNLQQNNPDTVTNENDKETPKTRYISTEERQNMLMI